MGRNKQRFMSTQWKYTPTDIYIYIYIISFKVIDMKNQDIHTL